MVDQTKEHPLRDSLIRRSIKKPASPPTTAFTTTKVEGRKEDTHLKSQDTCRCWNFQSSLEPQKGRLIGI